MRSVAEIFRSYGILDSRGVHVGGTDKETNHRYGDAYEQLFAADGYSSRKDVELMIEIGVADGSSLLAWREVFPNAICVGMDIHHSDKAHGDRIEFCQGDQRSLVDCEMVARGREFDFICEDATHNLGESLQTLLYLWPYVRAGGLYVIEEFANVSALRGHISVMWPFASIVDTIGPFGGVEPLVVLRKPP